MKALLAGSVLLLASLGCNAPRPPLSDIINQNAALPASAPLQPLSWRVVTSSIDRSKQTMSTLFGNDIAVDSARSAQHTNYPAGSVLALVTWQQQEDPHWFGGRIPKGVVSMEIVRVAQGTDGRPVASYELYQGPSLERAAPGQSTTRQEYILNLRAAVMP